MPAALLGSLRGTGEDCDGAPGVPLIRGRSRRRRLALIVFQGRGFAVMTRLSMSGPDVGSAKGPMIHGHVKYQKRLCERFGMSVGATCTATQKKMMHEQRTCMAELGL